MKCIKIIVPKRMEGERLDVAIAEMLPEYSRSKITSWIKSGEAMINEKIFKPRDKVSGDEIVSLALNQESNYVDMALLVHYYVLAPGYGGC